jgi:hypothetical protein
MARKSDPKGSRRGSAVHAAKGEIDPAVQALIDRRKLVREWWSASTAAAAAPPDCPPAEAGAADGATAAAPLPVPPQPKDMVGLALSGGGIRSATFSLGLLQALAKQPRDAFSKIDVISSVSGGGYIACFLRSLFMPRSARGIVPGGRAGAAAISDPSLALDPRHVERQYQFARDVLESSINDRDIPWPRGQARQRQRNPLWWLREHSRYLAPSGPTDYGYAAAYLTRNWLAMLYIFLLAIVCIFTVAVAAEAVVLSLDVSGWPRLLSWPAAAASWVQGVYRGGSGLAKFSPIVLLAIFPFVFSNMLMISYWMTQRMSQNEHDVSRQWKNLLWASSSVIVFALLVSFLLPVIAEPAADARPVSFWVPLVLKIGVAITGIAAAFAILFGLFLVGTGSRLTAELRRRLTKTLAGSNWWILIFLSVALVDTLGAWLARQLRDGVDFGIGTALTTSVVPVLAVLMNKLSSWLGAGRSASLFSVLTRFIDKVALIAGVLLFGIVAVVAVALVHLAIWQDDPWTSGADMVTMVFFIFVAGGLGLLAVMADGFINLSSLHSFYASRLTRAYLGASNLRRLIIVENPKRGYSIRDNAEGDYIQPELYSRADLPAPIHIINATLNETLDATSQIVARDRKGCLLTVEPGGVRVGDEMVPWANLGGKCAEQISLGQWCAISGAAASSGMGRLTNLGFALSLTFANVRLGYWWWSPGVCRSGRDRPLIDRSSIFGPFLYLFNEMTARYSRSYQRKYLTDGGHFENTGAYRLIEQRVPLIIVSDNGADPDFQFSDLENLTRKVRLDLGGELEVLRGNDLVAFARKFGCTDMSVFVDPIRSDWREQLKSPPSTGFVLGLQVRLPPNEVLDLLWVKPRRVSSFPPDLAGYALVNRAFPQQPTSDQFFDEAQWESYRKLGELCMGRLLGACPGLLA